ncbi:uncharacterized protein LOC105628964 isoform X2 [Jatropha curcas]|uniref:uncharacterized protein LOC105628964 isoform X2 n=1 Tax=Jatropha curcas TaxID=180498 RepID=UPI0009D66E6D|nr:uncharacterized protein LOC105628964 isoform X2 [Jatropha curcas]
MDEEEFRRLLDLFPVVRSRDYHYDSDPSRQSTSRPPQNAAVKKWEDEWEEKEGDKKEISNQDNDLHDAFWEKLMLAVERKGQLCCVAGFVGGSFRGKEILQRVQTSS